MSKRCVDLILAFCILLCALPVLLLCALLIKLDDHGPVFFRQTRMGRHFRLFALLKLRTMEDRSRGRLFTVGDDPRITRVGRWLRDWKLDELPQIWNILRGDMSIVGPRPVVPEIVREYHGAYESLLTVRPGLTDPASLKYFRESELLGTAGDPQAYFKDVVTPDKLRLSARYIETATVGSDLKLMCQTAAGVLESIVAPLWNFIWPSLAVARSISVGSRDALERFALEPAANLMAVAEEGAGIGDD